MEIISCVGARVEKQKGFPALKLQPIIQKLQTIENPLKNRMNIRSYSNRPMFRSQVRRNFNLHEILIRTGDLADFIIANGWLFLLGFLAFATPVVINSIFTWNSGFAKTIELQDIPSSELEILNKAMADFALDVGSDVDENGNLLNPDGSTAHSVSPDFRQKVSFTDYKVQAGDTISGITKKFGLANISTLIAVNSISNVRQLRSGQKLRIPSTDGLIHNVSNGDSLNSLSVKYQVTVEDLLDVNDLDSPELIAGQKLFIPGAKLSSDTIRMAMGELFIYPLTGKWRLTSYYGPRSDPFTGVKSNHTGIDMAMPQGTPVKASMSGRIESVGYTNIFGNYVIIKHINGYQTMYAHLSKSLVKTGQRVDQGARIGLVGSTGYSTGPHLHFMVFKNGKHIDPLSVLKK